MYVQTFLQEHLYVQRCMFLYFFVRTRIGVCSREQCWLEPFTPEQRQTDVKLLRNYFPR
jgi:hypothetical protein